MRDGALANLRDRWLWLVVIVSTLVRLSLAKIFFGFVGGDDVEILQEAFRVARGLDYHPWEIRNLLLPDFLVAPVVRVAEVVGVHDSASLIFAATTPFILLASLNVILLYVLALRWSGSVTTSRVAAAIFAFHWLPLGFGSTPYPRTPATTCVLIAALLVSGNSGASGSSRTTTRPFMAGAVIALAFAMRYSEAIFLLPLLALCWYGSEERRLALSRVILVAGGFALGVIVTVGVFDLVTWGRPFASLAAFARYTILEKQSSSQTALQSPFFYLERLWFWFPPTLLPGLFLGAKNRAARASLAFVVLPVLCLSFVHHKELRYVQACVPFMALAGAVGLGEVQRRMPRYIAPTLLILTLASEVLGVRFLAAKSMAAVMAAREIASRPEVRVVALSQEWAYGGRLYFGNGVEVRALDTPPEPDDLERKVVGASFVGFYEDDVARDARLEATLARYELVRLRTVRWGSSKTVVLYRSPPRRDVRRSARP